MSPDFHYAVHYSCWHSVQWANRTLRKSQRERASDHIKKLIDDTELCQEIENRYGIDVYLDRFLREIVKCAEVISPFADIIRFGVCYIDYQRQARTRLKQLREFLENNKPFQAIHIAESLPEVNERLGCFAIIGCWAADVNNRVVLTNILDRISKEQRITFDPIIPLAWSFIGRLIAFGDKELLKNFISIFPENEYGSSGKNLLPAILRIHCKTQINLDFIKPLLEKSLKCDIYVLDDYVRTVAEIVFKAGVPHTKGSEFFISFLNSIQNAEQRLVSCHTCNVV